jgi:hypothetical protein
MGTGGCEEVGSAVHEVGEGVLVEVEAQSQHLGHRGHGSEQLGAPRVHHGRPLRDVGRHHRLTAEQ